MVAKQIEQLQIQRFGLVSVELANKILSPKNEGRVNLNCIGQSWEEMENERIGCGLKGEPEGMREHRCSQGAY